MYIKKFITYYVANAVVLYLVSVYASNFVVFGRSEIVAAQALLTTAFGLTLAAMLVDLVLRDFNIALQSDRYLTLELGVNIVTLYVLALTPLQSSVGVGITAFWVAILTGFGLSLAQFTVKSVTDKAKS